MSKKCNNCQGSNFVHPPGAADLSMPCPKCNSDGAKSPVLVYTDSSKFPFGVHKGKTFSDVPDSYFIWLIAQKWIQDWPAVWAYIEENFKDEIA